MSVYKRGNRWWIRYYVKENGELVERREATGFTKKSDAQAYEGKILSARKENRLFDIKKEYTHTFDELLEHYREAFKGQRSFKDKKHHLALFERTFSGKLLADITPYQLETFRNERKRTLVKSGVDKVHEGYAIVAKNPLPPRERKVASVNRELSTLRHMFSKAVEWGMVESSPFSKVKRLFYKENNQRTRFLTEVEEIRLYKKIEFDYLKNIVTVALHTGMRKGEILFLKWAHIRDGFIYLSKTKTDEARQVPINDTLKALFASLPRHISSDYVFHNGDGKPYGNAYKSFNTAVREAGIIDFKFHDLRHTFASRLVMAGKSLQTVQKLLGHKNMTMTMRYAHLADSALIDAVKALDGGNGVDLKNRHNLGTVEEKSTCASAANA